MSDLFSIPFEEDPAERADAPAPVKRRTYTVAELTTAIRGVLEKNFGEIYVEGEISNCRAWNTGHVYFTLKDGDAQIKAVMFRSAVRYLRFKPEDGLHVVARGRLDVYEPKGEYQLVCEHMEPHGLGALQLAFEQLKKKLQAEGLFDAKRKRPL
ncbi:MAG TPA: exodeoxyribonuclease VII large subunit, partial [Vicinamibacterales bacterium]|nr:exodeoxyribonuclease VII large subunit [Vicinamibacterales bacterium]